MDSEQLRTQKYRRVSASAKRQDAMAHSDTNFLLSYFVEYICCFAKLSSAKYFFFDLPNVGFAQGIVLPIAYWRVVRGVLLQNEPWDCGCGLRKVGNRSFRLIDKPFRYLNKVMSNWWWLRCLIGIEICFKGRLWPYVASYCQTVVNKHDGTWVFYSTEVGHLYSSEDG